MKTKYAALMVLIIFMAQACSAGPSTPSPSPQASGIPPVTETLQPSTPEVLQVTSEVSTSVPLNALSTETPSISGNIISESGITFDDKDKTFNLKVGDSFLLNLGMDVYDWTVSTDNENVLRMRMGVMVIKGAQGIYEALAPGTAILTATGDPHCRQSKPACGIPSIIFTVTIIAK